MARLKAQNWHSAVSPVVTPGIPVAWTLFLDFKNEILWILAV